MGCIYLAKKYKIEKSNKKNKWNLSANEERINPNILFSPIIEITGNSVLTLEGCHGVLEYTDTYMKLKLQKGVLIICGSDFDITLFENKLISVKGNISSVEFCV